MKMRLFYIERIEDYLNQFIVSCEKDENKKRLRLAHFLKTGIKVLIKLSKIAKDVSNFVNSGRSH